MNTTISMKEARAMMDTIAQYMSMSIGYFAPRKEWVYHNIEEITDIVNRYSRDCFVTMCSKLGIEKVEEDA